jgi:hypothetical protein
MAAVWVHAICITRAHSTLVGNGVSDSLDAVAKQRAGFWADSTTEQVVAVSRGLIGRGAEGDQARIEGREVFEVRGHDDETGRITIVANAAGAGF